MEVDPTLIPLFFQVLRDGFVVVARVGIPVKGWLSEALGMDAVYAAERIQTVFLDGKPVDNVDTAVVRDGSTLALSAAMPGLVGAVFRKGGYYRAMRGSISHREEGRTPSVREGRVLVKLFNLLAQEQGPRLLREGIRVSGEAVGEFLHRQTELFWSGCRDIVLDGNRVQREDLGPREWEGKEVVLKVTAGPS
jgi:hypothetical protein